MLTARPRQREGGCWSPLRTARGQKWWSQEFQNLRAPKISLSLYHFLVLLSCCQRACLTLGIPQAAGARKAEPRRPSHTLARASSGLRPRQDLRPGACAHGLAGCLPEGRGQRKPREAGSRVSSGDSRREEGQGASIRVWEMGLWLNKVHCCFPGKQSVVEPPQRTGQGARSWRLALRFQGARLAAQQ